MLVPGQISCSKKSALIAATTIYAFTQVMNDILSITEIIHFNFPDFETDPAYLYGRLATSVLGGALVLTPSVLLAKTVYRNRMRHYYQSLLPLADQEQHHHGIGHLLSHGLIFSLISFLSVASSLELQSLVAELRGTDLEWPNYLFSVTMAPFNAWGFLQIHQHHIEETSEHDGVFSKKFLSNLYDTFVRRFTWKKASILLAHLGGVYFILQVGFVRLGVFDAYPTIFRSISLAGSMLGLIEGNSEARCSDNMQMPVIASDIPQSAEDIRAHNAVKNNALFGGILHAIDAATGMAYLDIGLVALCFLAASSDSEILESNVWWMFTLRVITWTINALMFVWPNARGFQGLVVDAYDRYEKDQRYLGTFFAMQNAAPINNPEEIPLLAGVVVNNV